MTIKQLKQALKSKVLWFNGLMLLAINSMPDVVGQIIIGLPALQPYLHASVYESCMKFALIVNFILRFTTRRPVLGAPPQ